MKYLIYILLTIILSGQCFTQSFSPEEQHQIDSLNKVLSNPNSLDTSLANAYVVLSDFYFLPNPDTLIVLCEKAIVIVNKGLRSLTPSEVFKEPIPQKRRNLLTSLADAYNNIGAVANNQGDIPKSLEYLYRSLAIKEKIGNNHGAAISLINIGYIQNKQADEKNAIKSYKKAISLLNKIEDSENTKVYALNNLGRIYKDQDNELMALKYYNESLAISESIGNKKLMGTALNNIGVVYKNKQDINMADEVFNRSLKIHEELGDKQGVAACLMNIGNMYLGINQFPKAEYFTKKALEVSQNAGIPSHIRSSALVLFQTYEAQENYNKALEMYKLYISMRDSINNEATQKATAQQEAKYEYEKQKAVDDAEHDKKIAIEQEAKEKQQIITYATAGGLGLVIVFLVFVFNRLQITRRQKNIIETQKIEVEQQKEVVELAHHELEEKNQEIMDSITYAKRIQSAILPPAKLVKEYLQESFILYKPKDIVAGDFYWLEHKDNIVLFAAADCTGHGVPGAMVSVVCNNGLNRSVREYGLTDPGEILNKTREIVIAEFEKSEEEVKDGMDIALCSLEGNKLQYAGAHNPLWIIRNGEIIETKANKQPIGQFDNPEPYTTHTIELQKGDAFYIFSDGYADQFGGEKGKKFKTANFKKLLLTIQNESIEKQKQLINESFETWKGNLEQLDDVCVIGVKV
jgi:serine phosphatase RsbU (regulator of sigma subunit)